MKLILASEGDFLWKGGFELFGIPKKEMRIGYVTTAAKGLPEGSYVEENAKIMRRAGYDAEPFDIEDKTPEEMRTFFGTKNIIHVEGGNSFYLLKAIRETGFDAVLQELLRNGIFYSGSSAGASVMGPSIETATWKSNDKDRYGLTDFTALGYVPFMFFAHYTDAMHDIVAGKAATSIYPVRILRDGQAIFVDGSKYEFVGEGKEIML